MTSKDEIEELIKRINHLVNSKTADKESDEFWQDSGAKLLIFIDQLVSNSESTFVWIPKEYSTSKTCLLTAVFNTLTNISDVNRSFTNSIWNRHNNSDLEAWNGNDDNLISFYELAISRCCSLICQQLGDRFHYIQKVLIKNLFGPSDVCSFFASDIYTFILRIIHPNQGTAMCQLIMNLCRMAPRESLASGAALVNRFKHPVFNFENPKYQYLLNFS